MGESYSNRVSIFFEQKDFIVELNLKESKAVSCSCIGCGEKGHQYIPRLFLLVSGIKQIFDAETMVSIKKNALWKRIQNSRMRGIVFGSHYCVKCYNELIKKSGQQKV